MLISRRSLLLAAISAPFIHSTALAGSKYGDWPGDEDPGTIVIITGDRTLHLVGEGNTRTSYAIAVGKEGMQWFGETYVTHKRKNPEWRPTPNMRKKDPSLPEVVKAGPHNPLGDRAIYLAEGYLRIHGTNKPQSIGSDASSGCFRLYAEDINELYELVQPGAKVVITQ
ncbi:L,D-transpeptidase [Rhizobium laguerreae]|uniref:L,D-transpeptidase n=1 Tax=Rhizobium laguerreae TaxID=1076926 RepID=UPI001C90224C|nr:L,D-transpeptidase [Rhizobium laguerreae]MBY3155230.1 L,D-transpeptidase [Rhizobium laguerreae]